MSHRWQNIEILNEKQSFEEALKNGQFDHFQNRTLIMIDLDRFRGFNKELGRKAGDLLLEELWKLIKRSIPDGTFALRYGGEEFLLITDGKQRAAEIAKTLQNEFSNLLSNKSKITLSFGIGMLPFFSNTNQLIARFNDISLAAQHRAKIEGRNRIIWLD
ncbi:MAG: GGDEF domain-containing protein [Candidatus Riflebacteria bacterium]|nr:GGDEF domain-containing protein [Candidatus Riflebacteria bacterium]